MAEKKKTQATNTHCKWCAAIKCSNSKIKRPDLSFHLFPSNPERCKQWIVNSRRLDLESKTPEQLHKGTALCSEHFEPCCFSASATKYRRLLRHAVPTLFDVPNPPPKLTSSRRPPKRRPAVNVVAPVEHDMENDEGVISSLKKKLCAERVKNCRFRRRLRMKKSIPAKSRNSTLACDLMSLKETLGKYLPQKTTAFILAQVKMSTLPKKGRRWTNDEKSFALSLYHSSRKAYRILQQVFHLPSTRTLSASMQNVNVQPGVSENMLSLFKIKVDAMEPREKLCSVIFDEMAIKSGASYDPCHDLVEGFEDYGIFGRTQREADHALVFMVRGLTSKWKQPVGYVLSHGTTKHQILKNVVCHVLQQLFKIGLSPQILICDQGSNNRAVLHQLKVTPKEPYFFFNGNKVFCLYDPPHLLKSMRNNLKRSGFVVDDGEISWDYIKQFYDMDSSRPIRMAPKLTSRHIEMPAFSNLNVALATQVLSHTVAAGISTMILFGAISTQAQPTVDFIKRMDMLFNSFNSHTLTGKSPMNHAITPTSNHKEFLEETLTWLDNLKCGNKTGQLPCIEGWKLSINALLQIWEDLQDKHNLKFLITSRLNQDCIENLFSVIRGKGGQRFNPDARELRSALRQVMVDSIMVAGDRKNCKDDLDTFLFQLDHIRSQGGPSAVKSRLQLEVPKGIQSIVQSTPTSVFAQPENNILNYIAGYVACKLRNVLCETCNALLTTQRDVNNAAHTFLIEKNFDFARSGLQAPSPTLCDVISGAEKTFRSEVNVALHVSGLRYGIIRKIMETVDIRLLCTSDKACDVQFLVINLYTNVRLHHQVKMITRGRQCSRKRKATTLGHT